MVSRPPSPLIITDSTIPGGRDSVRAVNLADGDSLLSEHRMTTEMVMYFDNANGVMPEQLHGFFVGWPNPPSLETHLRLLRQSDYVFLAKDEASGAIVGYITAIADGVLCAYISFLEVIPAFQRQGIGRKLVELMLQQLVDYYMVDLVCDAELQSFYARLGLHTAVGMSQRNYARQAGRS